MIFKDVHMMFDGFVVKVKFLWELINIIGTVMDGLDNPGPVESAPATRYQIPQNPLH